MSGHSPSGVPQVFSITVTKAGRAMASRLPYPEFHGNPADRVDELWNKASALVLFLPVGAATRIIAPLLGDKESDPAVVCVDEGGRFAVSLVGGHHGRGVSANELAVSISEVLGSTPVVTSGTDVRSLPSFDDIPGFTATGDVAAVTRLLLDGAAIAIENPLDWPLPRRLVEALPAGSPAARIVVTDRVSTHIPEGPPTLLLHPPTLVLGVGADSVAPPDELRSLVMENLARAGLLTESVSEIATVDRRAREPAVLDLAAWLGIPVRSFLPSQLAPIEVPNPSAAVTAALGTPSVAEAAALLAAGRKGTLIISKEKSAHCTMAVARRHGPRGSLQVVGLGPGSPLHRSPAATTALLHCDVLIGYGPYVDQCADLLSARHEVHRFPIGDEIGRARKAVEEARAGHTVTLVCSGDPGVFAMAPMVLEAAGGDAGFEIEIIPGISAAYAAAALLGAPLAHDHAVISLSDLTTPWETIARRLDAVARSGMAVALYNPRSERRQWQFREALAILAAYRDPDTPVGLVTSAARPDQQVSVTTLAKLDEDEVTMTTCVIVGSPDTRIVGGRMVTPRGRPVR